MLSSDRANGQKVEQALRVPGEAGPDILWQAPPLSGPAHKRILEHLFG